MIRTCHNEKSKKSIKVALQVCWTQVLFENVLRFWISLRCIFFWRTHSQDAQRKLPRQRVAWACALVTRNVADDVVTQFSDSEDENHDVQIEIPTDNADHTSADTPGIADLLVTMDWFHSVLPNPCSCGRKHKCRGYDWWRQWTMWKFDFLKIDVEKIRDFKN